MKDRVSAFELFIVCLERRGICILTLSYFQSVPLLSTPDLYSQGNTNYFIFKH